LKGPEGGLDRLDSVSVRVDGLVKDGAKRRRLWRSSILDKSINTNNWQPSDQGRTTISADKSPIVTEVERAQYPFFQQR
jgi:hypothetical protein